jgi:hypothetical protein
MDLKIELRFMKGKKTFNNVFSSYVNIAPSLLSWQFVHMGLLKSRSMCRVFQNETRSTKSKTINDCGCIIFKMNGY